MVYNKYMEGFKPIFYKNSNVLILGSFPSVISRKNNFYYGNKHNKFWKTMEKIFNVQLNSVEDKICFIKNNHLALWDIVESCEIEGSLDVNIKNVKFANLKKVLPPNTNVHKILCNGKKSFDLTKRYLKQEQINIEIVCLPSTSPANTRFNIENWKNELNK